MGGNVCAFDTEKAGETWGMDLRAEGSVTAPGRSGLELSTQKLL